MGSKAFAILLLIINSLSFIHCTDNAYNCNSISATSVFEQEFVNLANESTELYFISNDTNYLNLTKQYSSNFPESILTQPSIIALVKSIDDIPLILSYAVHCGYKIVIRSGGHQYSGLSSCNHNIYNCIQIDVSSLNTIEVLIEKEVTTELEIIANNNNNYIVSADPGVTLFSLYNKLSEYDLFLPAGVGQTVNLGGHVQTNGFGLLTRSVGLLTEYVISFDIILYNGTICHVSKYDLNNDKNELFFAVLGGNPGNFGVVVNYKFAALKNSDYINSTSINCQWIYNKNVYKQLMNGYIDVHNNPLYIDNNDVMLYLFILPPITFNNTDTDHILMLFGIWTHNISMNIIDYIINQVNIKPILYEIDADSMSNLLIKNSFPTPPNVPPMYLRAGYTKRNWNKSFIDIYIDDIDYALSNNLYLQVLFQSYGGKNSKLLNSNIGSFNHKDIFLALEMFMYFYNENKDIAANWIDTTWNKWTQVLFKEKIKIFFGTFGNHDNRNINMNQMYRDFYETESFYNELREIKTKFDPIDLFHHPLGLPLIGRNDST